MIEALRTPERRFADLPDFPFSPQYLEDLSGYEGLRMAYLDEGPADAPHTFLCLHGQPTWSFMYRSMIPVFIAAGHRVVAPDLFGFGRSDKPVDDAVYTFNFHRGALLAFISRLDLRNITLVVHDWGGILGLTLPTVESERYTRLIVMNTALATGKVPPSKGFLEWRAWVAKTPDMAVGRLMGRACSRLNDAERAAYDAPFPDIKYKAGVRRFPALVPTEPNAPGTEEALRAQDFWANKWKGQSFMAVGMQDPVLGPPAMRYLRRVIHGCPPPYEIEEAGHFVPEWGDDIAHRALAALGLAGANAGDARHA